MVSKVMDLRGPLAPNCSARLSLQKVTVLPGSMNAYVCTALIPFLNLTLTGTITSPRIST